MMLTMSRWQKERFESLIANGTPLLFPLQSILLLPIDHGCQKSRLAELGVDEHIQGLVS
jgi:hypothetical protein